MKKIKPGQIYVNNGKFVRAKKRIDGCNGCILNSPFICPNIQIKNAQKEKESPNCEANGIIFVRF